jgi:DNA-binding IclR family transcriptional regulator
MPYQGQDPDLSMLDNPDIPVETLPTDGQDKDPRFAYTLAKGMQVLRAFDPASPFLSNAELAARTGIARQTVVRLTRTLALLGYLQYHSETARYRLAAAVLSLGYPLLSQLSVRQMARPQMQELANFARGAVSIAIRSGDSLVIVESCVDHMGHAGRPDVGAKRDFHDTSLGMAYISSSPPQERAELMASLALQHGKKWSAVQERLAQAQAQFDQHRYCTALTPGVLIEAVAVPLCSNFTGERLVMNCTVPRFVLAPESIETHIAPRLLHLVRSLESTLGVRSPH